MTFKRARQLINEISLYPPYNYSPEHKQALLMAAEALSGMANLQEYLFQNQPAKPP